MKSTKSDNMKDWKKRLRKQLTDLIDDTFYFGVDCGEVEYGGDAWSGEPEEIENIIDLIDSKIAEEYQEGYNKGYKEGEEDNNIPSSNNKRLIKLVEGMFPEKHRSKYWYTRGHVEPNESYKEAKQDLLKQIGGDNANN